LIVTLEEFQEYVKDNSTGNDDVYTEIILAAQNLIEKFLNYELEKTEKTIIRFGNDANEMDFTRSFVPIDGSVELERRLFPTEAWTDEVGDYVTYIRDGLNYIWCERIFDGEQQYKFVFTSGYEVEDVPAIIKVCCKELAAHMRKIRENNLHGIKQRAENINGSSATVIYDGVWNKSIEDRLQKYRIQ
jgi:hypothetical protein